MPRANRHFLPGHVWHLPHRWSESLAVGSKRFVDKVKSELGIHAKHRKVGAGDEAYRSHGGQALPFACSAWTGGTGGVRLA